MKCAFALKLYFLVHNLIIEIVNGSLLTDHVLLISENTKQYNSYLLLFGLVSW